LDNFTAEEVSTNIRIEEYSRINASWICLCHRFPRLAFDTIFDIMVSIIHIIIYVEQVAKVRRTWIEASILSLHDVDAIGKWLKVRNHSVQLVRDTVPASQIHLQTDSGLTVQGLPRTVILDDTDNNFAFLGASSFVPAAAIKASGLPFDNRSKGLG